MVIKFTKSRKLPRRRFYIYLQDLWQHKDVGTMKTVTVALGGDSDSRMFKLTKA